VDSLRNIGHIDGQTQLVGIIGSPVAHSLSPEMHNAAFAYMGLNWRYIPLLVRPDQLAAALKGIVALNFRGVNITIPHKVAAIPLMDSVTEAVTVAGAVNTVRIDGSSGRMEGMNTDMTGFLADLAAHKIHLSEGMRVIVLGAGGAARAVGAGLARSGAQITFINRTPEKAAQVVEFLKASWSSAVMTAAPFSELAAHAEGASLIVNTTAVGIWPNADESPWPEHVPFPKNAVVYDTVYRPRHTLLMKQAEKAGLMAVGGLGMLVYQGAAAFEMWTRQKPPIEVMRAACEQRLGD